MWPQTPSRTLAPRLSHTPACKSLTHRCSLTKWTTTHFRAELRSQPQPLTNSPRARLSTATTHPAPMPRNKLTQRWPNALEKTTQNQWQCSRSANRNWRMETMPGRQQSSECWARKVLRMPLVAIVIMTLLQTWLTVNTTTLERWLIRQSPAAPSRIHQKCHGHSLLRQSILMVL